jgi:RHS repeat-associated protein
VTTSSSTTPGAATPRSGCAPRAEIEAAWTARGNALLSKLAALRPRQQCPLTRALRVVSPLYGQDQWSTHINIYVSTTTKPREPQKRDSATTGADPSLRETRPASLGQMTSQTISGTATNFAYDGASQNNLITDGTHTLHNDILGVASTTTSSATTYYTRNLNGQQIDERTPSGTYNYLYDGNGNVTGLTDSSGHLVRQYAYDPYGNLTYNVGTTTNPFGYQDGYQTTNGLYHYRARYENPTNGDWTQQDPANQITDLTQDDRYTFDGTDPINLTDLDGESTSGFAQACVQGAVIGAGVGVVSSGGTLSAADAGFGCASGAIGYDFAQASETAGQVFDVSSDLHDIADVFGSL